MLKVGSQSLGLESSPDGELGHAGALDSPRWEVVCVGGVGFLLALDGWAVDEEEGLIFCIRDYFVIVKKGWKNLQ